MKTIILLIITLLLTISCTYERESEHYNPNHLIKVNFAKKEAFENNRKLNISTVSESKICDKIVKSEPLPSDVKFSSLCSGGNDKGINFSYVIVSGQINGYFLIIHNQNRILSFRLENYNSADCLKKWIIEI